MEIEEARPRRPRRNVFITYYKTVVPVIIAILILLYTILSLLPGKQNADPEQLLKLALNLAPVKEPWNETKF